MENKESRYNLIKIPSGMPTEKNPYCSISTTHVAVDIFSETFPYDGGDGKFGLKKPLLWRLAEAAGIQWGDGELIKSDNTSVVFKSVAFFRCLNGSFTPFSTTKELNLPAEEKQLYEKYRQKGYFYKNSTIKEERDILGGLTPEEWAKIQVAPQILILRKHKVAIAETGSKLRLIRTVLDLKSGYTEDELEQGFMVEKVLFEPDYNDPEIRKMFLQMGFSNPLYQSVNKTSKTISVPPPKEEEPLYIPAND